MNIFNTSIGNLSSWSKSIFWCHLIRSEEFWACFTSYQDQGYHRWGMKDFNQNIDNLECSSVQWDLCKHRLYHETTFKGNFFLLQKEKWWLRWKPPHCTVNVTDHDNFDNFQYFDRHFAECSRYFQPIHSRDEEE